MGWRVAKSLDVLMGEVRTISPGQVIGTIGDEFHKETWSDHNPSECCDVVCAADIMAGNGLDLEWVAGRIVATDPPALKYVIWHDRIWFPGLGWQPYSGEYHTHVHVSVGWGPDGRSTGPYDDTSSWGLLPTRESDEMKTWVISDGASSRWETDGFLVHPLTSPAELTAALDAGAIDGGRVDIAGLTVAHPAIKGARLFRVQTGGLSAADVKALATAIADKLPAAGDELPAAVVDALEALEAAAGAVVEAARGTGD